MQYESEHNYAINSAGQRIGIGPVPGAGPLLGVRFVERTIGERTVQVPHLTKADALGNPVEWVGSVRGWVRV
ncbi:MAG TPA: hypothetical protein VF472_12360 [Burkholderiaceae bacterium]